MRRSTTPRPDGAVQGTRRAVVALALVSAGALTACSSLGDDLPGQGAPQIPDLDLPQAPDPDHTDPHGHGEIPTETGPTTEGNPYSGETPSDWPNQAPVDDGVVTIGVLDGWAEGEAVTELWAGVLDEAGYDVDIQRVADPTALYFALENGDVDLFLDAWVPNQQDMIDYAPTAVDLGAWLDEAPLTIAVNEDAPVTSIPELAEHGEEFGNEIIGIEPGSGLNRAVRDDVLPAYGLDDIELIDASTPEMLDRLEEAIDAGENIAVALWQPNAVYADLPLRDLEDPDGAFGETDSIHVFSSEDFQEYNPEVTNALEDFTMSLEQIDSLLSSIEDARDPAAGVEAWSEENADYVDGLFTER
ncbi:Glycine betaine ABC transport system, permease/glycine betaine-binding protein OpuABC [Actinomycetales bacterium JB111]|nr:Glycine betaine ABC transport system, permease/glycine betaine-binding protein OpuABC [Actinomycetales bacterium JB111]